MKGNTRIAPRAQLTGFVCVLCTVVLAITACSRSPEINETVRKEAETIADQASAAYKEARSSVSLDNKYSWQGAIEVNDEKTRNEKFTAAAKGLEVARDKFLDASKKMKDALGGQAAFDNKLATRVSRTSEAYKYWSDLAEFERKTWKDAAETTDANVLKQNLSVAQQKQQKMNEVLMAMMQGIGQ